MYIDTSEQTKQTHFLTNESGNADNFLIICLGTFTEKLPYIRIKTKARDLRFLVDTGANVSLINTGICHPSLIESTNSYNIGTINNMVAFDQVATIPNFKEFDAKDELKFHDNIIID